MQATKIVDLRRAHPRRHLVKIALGEGMATAAKLARPMLLEAKAVGPILLITDAGQAETAPCVPPRLCRGAAQYVDSKRVKTVDGAAAEPYHRQPIIQRQMEAMKIVTRLNPVARNNRNRAQVLRSRVRYTRKTKHRKDAPSERLAAA